MNELLVLVCLSVWLLLYLLGWDVFISTHEFLTFPFLILSPVPLAGVSSCMGMSFCLGLNHNSCSQLCKTCAEISAGLWNKLYGFNHHIIFILRELLLPKYTVHSQALHTSHFSHLVFDTFHLLVNVSHCQLQSNTQEKKEPHVFWEDSTSFVIHWSKVEEIWSNKFVLVRLVQKQCCVSLDVPLGKWEVR